jgi:hypothetical protein
MRSSMVEFGSAEGDEEDSRSSGEAPMFSVERDEMASEMTSQAPAQKVYGLGWFNVDQPASAKQAPVASGGVTNCGVCAYDQTSGTLNSLPPELFNGLAPRTRITLTLQVGEPGFTFEWDTSESAQRVEFPLGMTPSLEAKWVYLLIPGNDYAIPVPIIREGSTALKQSMSRMAS